MYNGKNDYEVLSALKDRQKLFSFKCPQMKERFSCVQCHDILVDPYQSLCGCRYCRSCIHIDQYYCSGCMEDHGSGQKKFCQDRAIEKEIIESKVHCINKNCTNLCKFRNLIEHMRTCEERQEICKDCGELFVLKEIFRHKNKDCVMIKRKCKDCGLEMTEKYQKERHNNINGNEDEVCDNWKDVCPYQCSLYIQDNLKKHFITCNIRLRPCAMKEIGCSKILNKSEMSEHIRSDTSEHLLLLMKVMSDDKEENKDFLIHYRENVKRKEIEINNLTELNEKNSKEIKNLSESIKGIENKYDNLQKKATQIRNVFVNPTILSEGQGQYTWKIEDIGNKIENAKNGVNMQIYSKGFYTSVRGYKMFLKIYPNGDGKGFGKCISVYFVIAKGEYDNEMLWPFNKKVSISLSHNRTGGKDRIVNMKPDLNESCYGKPTQEYNLAAGQPRFISHMDLICTDEYVENGSITVTTKVT